ncbi:MAG: LppX_LprAFG lipoprotein [Chloroflexi bacterium]|nr:LppX_LprAFG lipoprotein [Chloroflexota bacterium]
MTSDLIRSSNRQAGKWPIRALWLLGLVCLMLAACAPTPPPLSAAQIAERAADKMAAVRSFHFAIEVSGQRKTIDPLGQLVLRRASGDVLRPDRAQSVIRVTLPGINVDVKAVGIGMKQWLTNPLTGRWEEAPAGWGYNPAVLFDANAGLATLLKRVEGLSRGADESLDGKSHYRLTGSLAGTDVAPMTAYMVTGAQVSFTLWVGADDFMLRKVHLTERESATADPTEWDIILSAFDQPVTIEAPMP